MLASLITAVRDASAYLPECAASVVAQSHAGPLEWCVFDDGSSDDTLAVLGSWRVRAEASLATRFSLTQTPGAQPALEARGVRLCVAGNAAGSAARGAGYGRNRAVELASPDTALLIFLDADDVMAPRRVEALLAASASHPGALLGSRYWREGGGRPRDMAWHNGMSDKQLYTQRLRETTLAQPTWAMTPATFAAAGGYNEDAPYNAEDLQFFYAHLARGGTLHRVPEPLVMYRRVSCSLVSRSCSAYAARRRHTDGGAVASRGVPAELIWSIRVRQLETVLAQPPWVRVRPAAAPEHPRLPGCSSSCRFR